MVAKPKSADSNRSVIHSSGSLAVGEVREVSVNVKEITEFPGKEINPGWSKPMLLVETCSGTFIAHYGDDVRLRTMQLASGKSTLFLKRNAWTAEFPMCYPRKLVNPGDTVKEVNESSLLDRIKAYK